MIDDEDSFASVAYEIEIMQLWDNLPDHYKTAGLLNKIVTTRSLLNQIHQPVPFEQQ